MSIIERGGILAVGLYCAMTIVNPSAGMQFASAQAAVRVFLPKCCRYIEALALGTSLPR
jgi:hypothetical protein